MEMEMEIEIEIEMGIRTGEGSKTSDWPEHPPQVKRAHKYIII